MRLLREALRFRQMQARMDARSLQLSREKAKAIGAAMRAEQRARRD